MKNVKPDFPILKRKINGKPLVYLDSTSTSQKPRSVIATEVQYYEQFNSNVNRGVNTLSEEATKLYENSRNKVAKFIDAQNSEIIFTRNATEALNLVAYTFGRQQVKKGNVILLTEMEHHSNIVPWQLLAAEKGATIDYVGIAESGHLNLTDVENKLAENPILFAFTHVSNVLGTINPVAKLAAMAKTHGATVVLDACQSAPHMPIDVKKLGVDFAAFSGHKMFGPTGIGFLYGKRELLEEMPPFLTGGDMIKTVSKTSATWNDVPWKFEAGTPNIAGSVALGTAVDYMGKIWMKNIEAHNKKIIEYCVEQLVNLDFVTVYPPFKQKCGSIAFNVKGVHPHDVASVLDADGIEIRTGHHCCQPLMTALGVDATCRASFQIYNDENDVDALVKALKKCKTMFKL